MVRPGRRSGTLQPLTANPSCSKHRGARQQPTPRYEPRHTRGKYIQIVWLARVLIQEPVSNFARRARPVQNQVVLRQGDPLGDGCARRHAAEYESGS